MTHNALSSAFIKYLVLNLYIFRDVRFPCEVVRDSVSSNTVGNPELFMWLLEWVDRVSVMMVVG